MEKIILNNIAGLYEAASKMLKHFGNHKIIAFYGNLGAGKTTLIQAICKILKTKETASSPTFSLINEYNLENNKKIYHFDFYRINKIEEIYDFGYEEYFYSGNLCFIEWPEKIENLLPENSLKFQINSIDKDKREIILKK